MCDCCSDCAICCAVCWCHPITTGQLWHRFTKRGMVSSLPGVSCVTVALFLWCVDLYNGLVSNYLNIKWWDLHAGNVNNTAQLDELESLDCRTYCWVSSAVGAAAFLLSCFIVMTVRQVCQRASHNAAQTSSTARTAAPLPLHSGGAPP